MGYLIYPHHYPQLTLTPHPPFGFYFYFNWYTVAGADSTLVTVTCGGGCKLITHLGSTGGGWFLWNMDEIWGVFYLIVLGYGIYIYIPGYLFAYLTLERKSGIIPPILGPYS